MFLELSRTSPLSGSNLSNDLLETATVSACCGFCQSCRNCCHRKTSKDMAKRRPLPPPASEPPECSNPRLKARKLRQDIEGNRLSWQAFCDQIDPIMRAVPEKMGCAIEMPHSIRIQAHQTSTGEVRGHGIVGENDLPEMSVTSVKRPVTLHGNDAVCDDEVHRHRRADIKDAPVDALPMQNILGPAVLCARHYTENVLHAQRDASPVVGFDLRHRHHEVGFEHSPGQPEVLHARIGGPHWHLEEFIAVQINEADLLAAQLSGEPALGKQQICISLVSGSLSNHNARGAQLEKRLGGCAYQQRIRIHLDAGDVLHEIRFEQHGLSAQVEVKLSKG